MKILNILAAVMLAGLILPTVVSAQASGCGLLPKSLSATISNNAPWYCPINQQIYSYWVKWMPLVSVVILLSFAIAGTLIMVGIAIKSERVKNLGIGEMYEATASTIIVVLFLSVCAIMFGLGPAVTVGNLNPYATSFHLISGTIYQAEGLYQSLVSVYTTDAFWASVSPSFTAVGPITRVLGFIANIQPFTTIIKILVLAEITPIATFLNSAIAMLYLEYYTILFFAMAAIPVFLIPGTIFRAFAPTRGMGGMMIAISMGFFLVMPSLFAVVYYFTSPTLMNNMAIANAQITRFSQGTGAETNALSASSPIVSQLQQISPSISSFWLLILFYPIAIGGITYAFIVTISDFIGGATYMGSRMRSFGGLGM
ncbi:MAG: hypothetical protein M1448_01755 [Candidatus Marsarchaeota archaeon]|jgi:hypothetical protein|nr:hypothetical protein [Candidatus Marsarchaeota archaeon]